MDHQLLALTGQEAAKPHAGVDEDVGLRLDAQSLCHAVESGAVS